MRLYDKQTTFTVIGGILLMYGLCLGLCGFFVYRFLIRTFDPAVYLLLAIVLCPLILFPILSRKSHAFGRFLLRCRFDKLGISCYGLGWRRFTLRWDDICLYGIDGYGKHSGYSMGILFLSTDPEERFDPKHYADINAHRIVFAVRDEIWDKFDTYMPEEMKKRLMSCAKTKQNCYYLKKRKP